MAGSWISTNIGVEPKNPPRRFRRPDSLSRSALSASGGSGAQPEREVARRAHSFEFDVEVVPHC